MPFLSDSFTVTTRKSTYAEGRREADELARLWYGNIHHGLNGSETEEEILRNMVGEITRRTYVTTWRYSSAIYRRNG